MFERLARSVHRRRWTVIGPWVLLFALSAVPALRVDSVLQTTIGQAPTEAGTGLRILEEEMGLPRSVVFLVYSSERHTAVSEPFRSTVERSVAGLEGLPGLVRVDSPYQRAGAIALGGHAAYALVWLDFPLEQAMGAMPEVRRRTALPDGDVALMITGAPAIYAELETATQRDLQRGELAAIPLVLAALLLVFRGVLASGLPVLIGGLSLVLSLGLMFFLAQVTEMPVFAKSIASLLALGIAVDYTLFMVSRFREEMRAGRSVEDGLAATVATAGRAVLFSGITTILGLSGLLLVEFSFLRSLGIAGIVVVALSVAVALTLVPAVLSLLGRRIDWLPLFPRSRAPGAFWHGLARRIMARPLLYFIPSAVFLAVLGYPFLNVRLGPLWAGTLPEEAPARVAWEVAQAEFGPGALTPIAIVVQSEGSILAAGNIGALYDYTRRLEALPGVERVDSIVNVLPGITREAYQIAYSDRRDLDADLAAAVNSVVRGNTTVISVGTPFDAASPEAKEMVERVRSVEAGPGLKRYVTGATASLQDSIEALYADFPKVVVAVVVAIYVALMLLLRSVVLALKAVVMNGLSILASFGALVFIFQEGHLEGLLGFKANGAVEASLPILLFCMVFGLGMDYGIFLLSRIREEYDRTGDNAGAVAWGMEQSGKIITSASLVVVAVGAAFALGDVILTKALGLGLALAVLIDATIVRGLLVPSLMRLLGRWNWWPATTTYTNSRPTQPRDAA